MSALQGHDAGGGEDCAAPEGAGAYRLRMSELLLRDQLDSARRGLAHIVIRPRPRLARARLGLPTLARRLPDAIPEQRGSREQQ